MEISLKTIRLKKRHPFTISRGTRTHSENVFLFVSDGIHTGVGEFDPAHTGEDAELAIQQAQSSLQGFLAQHDIAKLSIHDVWQMARAYNMRPTAQAGLDIALWDLYGKQTGQPCYRLFGLKKESVPTSITLGITPLELIPERLEELLRDRRFRYLKIKLGSPAGIDFDKEAFRLIKSVAAPYQVGLRVDANGGWSLADAKLMCQFLAAESVDYIEQPLHKEMDEALPELFKHRPLPIFVDESCQFASDVARFAACADGINVKLMKCGGLTEALRMVATARAVGLQTMIGCMSESSISISAAASIGALFDHIDLDSHFNLDPDPASGAILTNGSVIPTDSSGHGAALC